MLLETEMTSRDLRHLAGLTLGQLGQLTKIDYTSLCRFEQGQLRLSSKSLRSVERALFYAIKARKTQIERALRQRAASQSVANGRQRRGTKWL